MDQAARRAFKSIPPSDSGDWDKVWASALLAAERGIAAGSPFVYSRSVAARVLFLMRACRSMEAS